MAIRLKKYVLKLSIQIVPESYKSQEIWDEAVHRFFFASDSIPD